jgi:ectoine hydroxylase-related dioxygenase (phytanoyl-CoA dioxygenase family)
MTFLDALFGLGVRDDTLTPDEKQFLDDNGYLPLANIITPEQAARMREAMTELFAQEKTGTSEGSSECAHMQNKSDAFDVCITHPRVLAAVAHVLKEEFNSLGVHSRPNPPGLPRGGLHVDWGGPPPTDGNYSVCNSMWPLCDFTKENGATSVVPGSHRSGKNPEDEMDDPREFHPREIQLEAPLGTVIIFNSHTWHSANANNSTADRPNVTSFWGRKVTEVPVMPSQVAQSTLKRVGPAARALFDSVVEG